MDNLKQFAKVLAVFLIGFIIIITNVEIWNLASADQTDGFHVVVSVLNFLLEGVGLYYFGKKVLFKKEKTEKVEK